MRSKERPVIEDFASLVAAITVVTISLAASSAMLWGVRSLLRLTGLNHLVTDAVSRSLRTAVASEGSSAARFRRAA